MECCICFEDIIHGENYPFIPDICTTCVKLDIWGRDDNGNNIHPSKRTKIHCKCGKIWNRECFGENAYGGCFITPLYYERLKNPSLSGVEKGSLHKQPGMMEKKHELIK